MKTDLNEDPRWRRLWNQPWFCQGCDQEHLGLMDLACDRPDHFPNDHPIAPNGALNLDDDFLSEDLCVLDGEHFFVRAVLELPIIGSDEQYFGFGVWPSLSQENFEKYVETFDSGEQENLGPWFGWFCNRLKGYPDTLLLKCQVHPEGGRRRPKIKIEPTDHLLSVEQRRGISFDRILELYTLNGHDIRLSLSD